MTERMTILTVDLEDWFHILDNDATRAEAEWARFPARGAPGGSACRLPSHRLGLRGKRMPPIPFPECRHEP